MQKAGDKVAGFGARKARRGAELVRCGVVLAFDRPRFFEPFEKVSHRNIKSLGERQKE
jgi:hypothetical protein